MYQYIEGAKFTQHLQNLDWNLNFQTVQINEQLATELLNGQNIQSFSIQGNEIAKGNHYQIIYDESQINSQTTQLVVTNGQISISYPKLNFQVIDYQFQFIQNDSFQNRHLINNGTISFDDRHRIILNSDSLITGCWICMPIFNLPQNQQFINYIQQFISSNKNKRKIKFTKQDSFLVVVFDVSATCILVTLGQNEIKQIYKPKVYKLWENFLNKNSFSSDLHYSINEYDQLEAQINQLSKEYSTMLKYLQEPSSQLVESVQNKNSLMLLSKSNHQTNNHNSIASHHYQGLLQVSSQKLFTGRSHIDTKREKCHLSAGQLSENSFLQDAPLINQINQ